MSSKVLKLVASNIKRLHVVEVTPTENVTTIGGANGAGKSSVLDALAYAAGGSKLLPEEPIRKGQAEGSVEVTLENHIIQRKFKRDRLQCDCDISRAVGNDKHESGCSSLKWGPTRSSLAVRTVEGASYPSPQAVLDDLFGKLTFDPLAFFQMPPALQDKLLRQIVNLNTGEIEIQRGELYNKRTELNRILRDNEALLKNSPFHADLPVEEIPLSEVSAQMLKAEAANKAYNDAERAVDATKLELSRNETECQQLYALIQELQRQITVAQKKLNPLEARNTELTLRVEELTTQAAEKKKLVPDQGAIRAQLTEIEQQNVKIRGNQDFRKKTLVQEARVKEIEALTKQIEGLDQQKENMLRAVKFPIEGLGFGENGLTFGDIPLSQASTAEQLKISMAIGMALNPKVKVLLIRNGNTLDEDSLKVIADLAEQHDYQVWMEWVTKNAEGVSVLIEDGSVAG